MERVEVAIVGAGVAGAAAAWALGKAGRDAVVLERFAPANERGSSHGPARIFRFAYDDPFYVSLAQRSLPLWRELEAVTGRALLTVTGGLDFGPPEYLSSGAAALRICGAQADILGAAEIRRRHPGIDFGGEHALWSPDTGVLGASACVEAMLAASGLSVRSGVAVERIEQDRDGATLTLSGGERLSAASIVLAAGAWTTPLLEQIGLRAPLQVSREQVFYFPGGDTLPVVIERGPIFRYFLPPAHGAPGAKAGEHGTGERTTADGRSFDIDPQGQARVCDWIATAFPAVSPQPAGAETCLYTNTPDEDFVFGRHGTVAFGSACSGHGFKFGPLIGETLAALALGADPPLATDRFLGRL